MPEEPLYTLSGPSPASRFQGAQPQRIPHRLHFHPPPYLPTSPSSAPTWRSAWYTTMATALDRFRQRTLSFIIGMRSARAARRSITPRGRPRAHRIGATSFSRRLTGEEP